jgi:replicative DNA helicase Mcm
VIILAEEKPQTEGTNPQETWLQLFKKEVYRQKFAQLSVTGNTSITVKFSDLIAHDQDLAENLIESPAEYLTHAKNAALEQWAIEDPEHADPELKIGGLRLMVRVVDLYQSTSLRQIGAPHIGKLIMIRGVVIRSSIVRPKAVAASFECRKCGERQIIVQDDPSQTLMRKPLICANPSCERTGPFEYVDEESKYVNEQEIWVQEGPDELPPGQLPRALHLKLYEDIVDTARPGDSVSVVGIVRSLPKRTKSGMMVTFDIFLDVNSITVLGKEPESIVDAEDINKITELARDPYVHKKILASIAPSIFGYDHIKEAIIYLLFGGVPKDLEDIKLRGEINILLIGDPGTAKSQLLRYVSRLAPRGLFTSGKGTTGVGLTAAVIKDQATGEYQLEAGALVLADKGVACIDEMDKMHESDRETIHETLEQHTVSIAKGGIVATLNARAAVLAAANPVLGRYNAFTSIVENISLPVTLLSRFDLIFLMRDVPNEKSDAILSQHILEIHAGVVASPVIDPVLLRKYIGYARQLKPQLTPEAITKIKSFYLQMRKASDVEGSPLAIGPRQLEALTRISEARARAALREQVLVEDAEAAIGITMKSLREVGIDLTSGKPDIDILMTGKPKGAREKLGLILKIVVEECKVTGLVDKEALFDRLEKEYSINKADGAKLLEQLMREGVIYEPKEGLLKKT